jgi:hypothetical protein
MTKLDYKQRQIDAEYRVKQAETRDIIEAVLVMLVFGMLSAYAIWGFLTAGGA